MSEQTLVSEKPISPQELAAFLSVPVCWVYGKTRQHGDGSIPRIKVGKYIRFHLSEVMDWLKKEGAGNV